MSTNPSPKGPTTNPREPVTRLMQRVADERGSAAADLLPVVYDELRRLAASLLRAQRPGDTLQPTALVHEAYLKLVDQELAGPERNRFFVVAAIAMRSILVDHVRARRRAKRGGGWRRITLHADPGAPDPADLPIEAIDAALARLAELDPRKARLVELRFFGGLTLEEAADVLELSRATASEDWRMARAWLYDELKDEWT
ncbi:MAG: ECF-type sigma factor [Phycisphaerae bacterium]